MHNRNRCSIPHVDVLVGSASHKKRTVMAVTGVRHDCIDGESPLQGAGDSIKNGDAAAARRQQPAAVRAPFTALNLNIMACQDV